MRASLVKVVDIVEVRRPVLCAGRCACLRFARLRFPCSRCVYLLCVPFLCMLELCALALPMLALRAPVPLLCVPALCTFVRRVVCLCSARLHRAALAYIVRRSSTSPTPHMPLPILSPIGLLLLAYMHLPAAAAWTLSAL